MNIKMKEASKIRNGRIVATRKADRLSFYLEVGGGNRHFLMCHSGNPVLWKYFKEGVDLIDIAQIKPKRSYRTQQLIHFSNHLLKVTDSFVKYEL